MRLLELIHIEPGRIPAAWSQVPESLGGAPRLYLFRTCKHAIEQLKSAPVAADGADAGEVVDPKWESAHAHSHASLRYGAMSRPSPSEQPTTEQTALDEREAMARRMLKLAADRQSGQLVEV